MRDKGLGLIYFSTARDFQYIWVGHDTISDFHECVPFLSPNFPSIHGLCIVLEYTGLIQYKDWSCQWSKSCCGGKMASLYWISPNDIITVTSCECQCPHMPLPLDCLFNSSFEITANETSNSGSLALNTLRPRQNGCNFSDDISKTF